MLANEIENKKFKNTSNKYNSNEDYTWIYEHYYYYYYYYWAAVQGNLLGRVHLHVA